MVGQIPPRLTLLPLPTEDNHLQEFPSQEILVCPPISSFSGLHSAGFAGQTAASSRWI